MATKIQQKVATVSNQTGNPVTVSATFDATPTANNWLVACLFGRSPTAAWTLTYSDNKSNTWTTDKAQQSLAVAQCACIGSAIATTTSATFTITASVPNTSATDCYLALVIQEWSGVISGVDKVNGQTLTGSQTIMDTLATATTTYANELFIAVCKTGSNSANTITSQQTNTTPSSGWTDDYESETGTEGAVATVIVASTQAARQVWSSANAADTTAAIATYQVASGAMPLYGKFGGKLVGKL